MNNILFNFNLKLICQMWLVASELSSLDTENISLTTKPYSLLIILYGKSIELDSLCFRLLNCSQYKQKYLRLYTLVIHLCLSFVTYGL